MCSKPIAHDTRLRDLFQNRPAIERLRELTWWSITIGQNNKEKCQWTQYYRADHLQAVAQPFICSIVVENHPHILVHAVHISLGKLVFLLEATDDHEPRHTLREMMENRSLGYWVQSCQFPRGGDVICLHVCHHKINIRASRSWNSNILLLLLLLLLFKEHLNLILMRIHIFKLCIHVSGHLVSQVDVAQREEDKTNRPCGLTQHNQHSQQREVGGQASPKEEWQHDIHGGLVRWWLQHKQHLMIRSTFNIILNESSTILYIFINPNISTISSIANQPCIKLEPWLTVLFETFEITIVGNVKLTTLLYHDNDSPLNLEQVWSLKMQTKSEVFDTCLSVAIHQLFQYFHYG